MTMARPWRRLLVYPASDESVLDIWLKSVRDIVPWQQTLLKDLPWDQRKVDKSCESGHFWSYSWILHARNNETFAEALDETCCDSQPLLWFIYFSFVGLISHVSFSSVFLTCTGLHLSCSCVVAELCCPVSYWTLLHFPVFYCIAAYCNHSYRIVLHVLQHVGLTV